ncbi:hypothetical protein, partial [Escherichia coli]|uniref:hypothetical protein n=1 Tax=Escherichia coli TaxID=562 RepID=UPI001AD93BFE
LESNKEKSSGVESEPESNTELETFYDVEPELESNKEESSGVESERESNTVLPPPLREDIYYDFQNQKPRRQWRYAQKRLGK